MTTKNYCLPWKDEQKVFEKYASDGHYSNLNLNYNNLEFDTVQSKSTISDQRKVQSYAFTKVSVFTEKSKIEKASNLSWKKSNKTSNISNIRSDNFDKENNSKNAKSSINRSTLSLHIAAYENSIEGDTVTFVTDEFLNGKRPGWMKNPGAKLIIQNPFEFPRQQRNKSLKPEIAQFKASQKLFNPNEIFGAKKQEIVGISLHHRVNQRHIYLLPVTGYGAPASFSVAYKYDLQKGDYGKPVNTLGLQAMSEREKCDKKSDEVADDWENVGDEQLISNVAERQKQLKQNETNLAVEQEQLKIHQKAGSANNQMEKKPEVGDGPIRLLRRQQKGIQQHKTEAELEAEAQERATQALEEREALYQQTRERIFGGEQPIAQQPEPLTSESLQAQLQLHLQQKAQQKEQQQQSSGQRDHLSDVQMKRADTRKNGPRQQQIIPQQPPPLNSLPMMMPPTSIPPPPVPWFFNGAAQPPPMYNIPPPQSLYGAPIPPPSQPIYGGPGFPAGMPPLSMPPPPPAQFHQYYQYYQQQQQQQLQGNPRNRFRY